MLAPKIKFYIRPYMTIAPTVIIIASDNPAYKLSCFSSIWKEVEMILTNIYRGVNIKFINTNSYKIIIPSYLKPYMIWKPMILVVPESKQGIQIFNGKIHNNELIHEVEYNYMNPYDYGVWFECALNNDLFRKAWLNAKFFK
jgi:hypothetical protein